MKKRVFRGWLQSVIAVLLSAALVMSGCSGQGSGTADDTASGEESGEK